MRIQVFVNPIFLLIALVILSSCSKNENPAEIASIKSENVLPIVSERMSHREIIAAYDVEIDSVAHKFTITRSDRISSYHIPLRYYFPDVLSIGRIDWTPFLSVRIRLNHPLPKSGIDGFDPRVIALIPANPGVSFNYPNLGITGNNVTLYDPDGFTKLFDSFAPSFPGNTNPFKAYFKDKPNRIWSSSGYTSEMQEWWINPDGLDNIFHFKLIVDVCTNFPNPPQPGIDNAVEPVDIKAQIGLDLTPSGGSTPINVTLIDWQGTDGIGGVICESPSLFNGTVSLNYSGPGPGNDDYVYTGTITNELHAPVGEYSLMVAAWDQPNRIYMYNEFKVYVDQPIEFNPVDVTPPTLNMTPKGIFVEGNYAYIGNRENGLHIYDISNPVQPVWLTWLDCTGLFGELHVSNGYAFTTSMWPDYELNIIDVDPPTAAHIVKTMNIPRLNTPIFATDGYAYTAVENESLQILDVDPPESAWVVKTILTNDDISDIYVSNGYAYIASGNTGMQVVDIDPLDSASLVKTVGTPGYATDVFVSGGYAYVTDNEIGLQIIDIEPLDSAYIVKAVELSRNFPLDIYVQGGYAYIPSGNLVGLRIIDIDPPESAYEVSTIQTPLQSEDVHVVGSYAFVAALTNWYVIDIDPPESPEIITTLNSVSETFDVDVYGDYAFVCTYDGLCVVDIEPLETANLYKNILLPSFPYCIYVIDGYAYAIVSEEYGVLTLCIIDIDPLDSAYIAKTVSKNSYDSAEDIFVSDGYAYVAANEDGFWIFDVEPAESAHYVNGLSIYDKVMGVSAVGDYAFVVSNFDGLHVIDVNPPESAYERAKCYGGTTGIFVYNGYAFTTGWGSRSGLFIIDITPPLLPFDVGEVETYLDTKGVYVTDGYAYVANSGDGLQIVDVIPPQNPSIVSSIDTPGNASQVDVSGNHAFIADNEGGLRIIKLW